MRAQATRRDQEDRPHPLRRACPDQSYHISQPHQEGEGPYSCSKVGVHPWHEAEGLQGGVFDAPGFNLPSLTLMTGSAGSNQSNLGQT
jgi:hypothetical protein